MGEQRRSRGADNAKNHPIIIRMREIREENRKRPSEVAKCMEKKGFPLQMVKRIESGDQKLPYLVPGTGISLHRFMEAWFECVEATEAQRGEVEELVQTSIFGEGPDADA